MDIPVHLLSLFYSIICVTRTFYYQLHFICQAGRFVNFISFWAFKMLRDSQGNIITNVSFTLGNGYCIARKEWKTRQRSWYHLYWCRSGISCIREHAHTCTFGLVQLATSNTRWYLYWILAWCVLRLYIYCSVWRLFNPALTRLIPHVLRVGFRFPKGHQQCLKVMPSFYYC